MAAYLHPLIASMQATSSCKAWSLLMRIFDRHSDNPPHMKTPATTRYAGCLPRKLHRPRCEPCLFSVNPATYKRFASADDQQSGNYRSHTVSPSTNATSVVAIKRVRRLKRLDQWIQGDINNVVNIMTSDQ